MDHQFTIESLYKTSSTQQINAIVNEIFLAIKQKIVDLHKTGASEIYYDLVDNLQIGNLDLKDAQLIVYSKLIEKFDQGGFKVSLLMDENGNRLHIMWPSILDKAEVARMRNIIKQHLEKPAAKNKSN